MNILAKTVGGGPFSKFMVAIQYIAKFDHGINLDDIENIYIGLDEDPYKNIDHNSPNPFDFFLEQDINMKFDMELNCTPRFGSYRDMFKTEDLPLLRKVVSKLKIKDDILKKIDPSLDNNTLGVHVRITDMEVFHAAQYGRVSMDMFVSKIKNVIREEGLSNIFVASDNDESIEYLKNFFPIKYNEVTNRSNEMYDDKYNYNSFLRSNFFNEKLWIDSIIEVLSISRCGQIIHRASNIANTAIMFAGDNLKKTHYIEGVMDILKPHNPETYKIDGCFMDDEKKFAFIHIYKNASISLRNILNMRGKYYKYEDIKKFKPIKIAIIRNPMDRVISMYLYLLRLEDNGFPNKHPTHITKHTRFYHMRNTNYMLSFDLFLDAIEGNNFYDAVTYPQVNFLNDRGLSIDDIEEVFLQETIQSDFDEFCLKYGLPMSVFPVDNTGDSEITQLLKTYIKTNHSIEERIAKLYKDDIDLYESIKRRK